MSNRSPQIVSGKDPVVRTLGNLLFSAPLATALALGVTGLGHRDTGWPMPAVPSQVKPVTTDVPPVEPRAAVQQAVLVPKVDAKTPLLTSAILPPDFAPSPRAAPTPRKSAPASARPGRGWHMTILRDISVADGLRLGNGERTVALAGIEPLEASCRRIDGKEETCAARALTRLELLVRGRTVTCRVYDAAQGETPAAHCRADRIDLAEDLVRNGLARHNASEGVRDLTEDL